MIAVSTCKNNISKKNEKGGKNSKSKKNVGLQHGGGL